MTMDDDALDRQLSALKSELSSLQPPPAVGHSVSAAIARAERAGSDRPRRLWRMLREYWFAVPLAAAAALAILVWTLRLPASDPSTQAASAATEFIPVVPVADIARTRGAYVVSAQMPRTMLSDFGLPVSPVRAAEPVDSELLVRADGTVLAVRFLE
jgi:hypothetical protein